MEMIGKATVIFILTLLITCAISFIAAALVMWLWNWLMPLFGITTLTYWQCWGLHWLCGLLFQGARWNFNLKE